MKRWLLLLLACGVASAQVGPGSPSHFLAPSNAPLGSYATEATLTAAWPASQLGTGGGQTAYVQDGTGPVFWNGSAWVAYTTGGSTGLTSVGLADTSTTPLYTVGNSPLTANGTLDFTLVTQAAHCFVGGPTSGSAAQPTCRALVASDIPSLSYVSSVALTVPSWLTVSGSPVTSTGTLAVTATTGLTANQVLATPNGTTGALAPRALVAADIPTIPSSGVSGLATVATSGSASDLTGTLAAAQLPAFSGSMTTTPGSSVTTIPAGTVTLAMQANLAANSMVGNNTASPATPIALTAAQIKTFLAIANTDVSGLGTLSTQNGTAPVGAIVGTSDTQTLTNKSIASTEITGLGTLATQSGTFSGTSSGTNTGDQTAANPTGTIGLTAVNGSSASFMRADGAPALGVAITPTWTGPHIWNFTGQTANTQVVANLLENTTTASSGNQQEMCQQITGSGWGTTTPASALVDWRICNLPVQGTTAPTSNLILYQQINGGGYNTEVTFTGGASAGGVNAPFLLASNYIQVGQAAPSINWSANTQGTNLKNWTAGVSGTTWSLGTATDASVSTLAKAAIAVARGATTTVASVTIGNATDSTAVLLPGLASSSAATTGTLCWTTGTGNVNVDTTLACLSSTRKVKQNIKPLDIGLSEVMQMRPVSYDLKPQFNPKHLGPQVGLVAEDVEKVDPRLVGYGGDGKIEGVRYMQMTAVLVKALQEEQAEIVALKKRVAALSHRH